MAEVGHLGESGAEGGQGVGHRGGREAPGQRRTGRGDPESPCADAPVTRAWDSPRRPMRLLPVLLLLLLGSASTAEAASWIERSVSSSTCFPAPRSTIARKSRLPLTSSKTAINSSTICTLIAFFTFGRLSVTVKTDPDCSSNNVSHSGSFILIFQVVN